jgi:hypothetical protein
MFTLKIFDNAVTSYIGIYVIIVVVNGNRSTVITYYEAVGT